MSKITLGIIGCLCVCLLQGVWAQTDIISASSTPVPESPGTSTGEPPGGFGNIKLGMDIDTVKSNLKTEAYFRYRGDPDVSFLPVTEEPLIACEGNSYISKGYFQFHDRKLFIIILELNQTRIDYFTMYQTFISRYGKPSSLDPSRVVWEFEEIRLSLERPLSIKYIATEVFDQLVAASELEEDFTALSRQNFLENF